MFQNDNLAEMNEVWQDAVLTRFVERMLIYYDPWKLIIMGVPDDEYNFAVSRVKDLFLGGYSSVEYIERGLSKILEPDFTPPDDLHRTIRRMAEDLAYLKDPDLLLTKEESFQKKIIFNFTPTEPNASLIFLAESGEDIDKIKIHKQMIIDSDGVQGNENFKGDLIVDLDINGKIVSIEIIGDVIPNKLKRVD